jgi:hypothetical protein
MWADRLAREGMTLGAGVGAGVGLAIGVAQLLLDRRPAADLTRVDTAVVDYCEGPDGSAPDATNESGGAPDHGDERWLQR